MDFTTLSGEALTAALAIDFDATDDAALTAALTARKDAAKAIFALDAPTIAQVTDVEAILASITAVEAEASKRDADAAAAGERFAAARATFSAADGSAEGDAAAEGDASGEGEGGDEGSGDAEGGDEGSGDAEGDAAAAEGDASGEGEGDAVTAAAQAQANRPIKSAARKVGAAQARTKSQAKAVQAAPEVVITASGNVPGVDTGSTLPNLDALHDALIAKAKGFTPWSERGARSVRAANGGQPNVTTFGVATLSTPFDDSLVASAGKDYDAVRAAIRQRDEEVLTAAGWCAPSEISYSYVADYVVDGLVQVPQVSAPRGGLSYTTGPQRSSQGQALSDFGFVQTEAQAEAGQEKTLEVIECPDFEEVRLDAVGYGFTIPFLTQKAYPELIKDTLKFAGVLWAHKMNKRRIDKMSSLSTVRTFEGYGPSLTDSLEALSILALKERRKWNLGENAIIQIDAPLWAKEVYRADMSRRSAVAFDSVPDAVIDKHFTDRHLSITYVADWQELGGENIILPGTFDVLVYPSGTFAEALEDVVNLSAFYDTASVTVNEYTGVFFEQGHALFKAAYGSSRVAMPVNTAGEMGGLTLSGLGDAVENGSF